MMQTRNWSNRLVTVAVATGLTVAAGITALTPGPAAASYPGANGAIVYASFVGSAPGSQIFAVDPAGGPSRDLSGSNYGDDQPAVSPDGHRIAFRHDVTIWIMDIDGGNRHQVGVGSEGHPSWSPDGTSLAFDTDKRPDGFSYGGPNIWTMKADGTDRIQLTDDASSFDPDWAPDNSKIAYVSSQEGGNNLGDKDIFSVNVGGGGITNLTRTPNVDETQPSWAPDASRIAYTSTDLTGHGPDTVGPDLWTMNRDGSGQTPLVHHHYAPGQTSDGADPAWSPDGSQIAFAANNGEGGIRVWRVAAGGGNDVPVTAEAGNPGDQDLSWQPLPAAVPPSTTTTTTPGATTTTTTPGATTTTTPGATTTTTTAATTTTVLPVTTTLPSVTTTTAAVTTTVPNTTTTTPGQDPVCNTLQGLLAQTTDPLIRQFLLLQAASTGCTSVPGTPTTLPATTTTVRATTTTVRPTTTTVPRAVPPVVSQVAPAAGSTNGGVVVTVTGAGFTGATQVLVGGAPVAFTVVDPTHLRLVTPPHAPGPVDIRVVTPGGTSPVSVADVFVYTAPPPFRPPTVGPAPHIDQVTPPVSQLGGTTVQVLGENLATATAVSVDGVLVPFTVHEYTGNILGQIGILFGGGSTYGVDFVAPPHAPGVATVTVTGPGGTSNTGFLIYTPVPAPRITSLDPAVAASSGGTTISVSGAYLASVTSVQVDGVSVPFAAYSESPNIIFQIVTVVGSFGFNSLSPTVHLRFAAPPHAPGQATVTVSGPGGPSNPVILTYR